MAKTNSKTVGSSNSVALEAGKVLDIRGSIRELLQIGPTESPRGEEVTFFVLPGRWSVAEFRDLLTAAA